MLISNYIVPYILFREYLDKMLIIKVPEIKNQRIHIESSIEYQYE